MPNRLIRDGLMESEALLSMPVEARWLFIVILLSADDLGLFEAKEFKLSRRADINRDLGGRLLQLLADADLVRLYEVDGERYGFIPKFRQRVQIRKAKFPLPPKALTADDLDAARKINDLASDPTVGQPLSTAGQPPEAEVEAEKKVSDASHPRRRRKAVDRVPACPVNDLVALYHEVLPELPKVKVLDEARRRAMRSLWTFVMTSRKSDGTRRATTAEAGMSWLRDYFGRVRDNDWLMGRTPRAPGHESWRCTLDFLCSPKGLKAVIERTETAA